LLCFIKNTYRVYQKTGIEKMVYYRLIALWILCETMLGGLIHGAKLPGSGLILGSCSVICISLIAYHVPSKGSILKATLIVAIFKMMLSPQASPAAYIAVFFQGLTGEALFWNRKIYSVSCLLFGILVLLESGLQRIVVLTIIYGKDLWEAFNTFINGITGQTTFTNYSFFFVIGYILIHVLVGTAVGLWVGRLPQKIHLWSTLYQEYLLTNETNDATKPEMLFPPKRKRKLRKSTMLIWLVLLLLYMQSTLHIGPALLSPNVYMRIFIRSLLIIMTFYCVVRPCLAWLLNRWLQKRKIRENVMIQKINQFLPDTKELVIKCWELTAKKNGGGRMLLCGKIILLNTLIKDELL
jgi:hypothetical protein